MISAPSASPHDSGITLRSRARILLVCDDPERCSAVATALRADGYSVVETDAASEVLTQLAAGFLAGKRHGGFDLVLSDARFLDAGTQLFERMRHAHLSTPVMSLPEPPLTTDEVRAVVADVLRDRSRAAEQEDEREEPILEVVATLESGVDAFEIKSMLRAHGIQAFLGSRALARATPRTDVYVIARDADAARALLAGRSREEVATVSR